MIALGLNGFCPVWILDELFRCFVPWKQNIDRNQQAKKKLNLSGGKAWGNGQKLTEGSGRDTSRTDLCFYGFKHLQQRLKIGIPGLSRVIFPYNCSDRWWTDNSSCLSNPLNWFYPLLKCKIRPRELNWMSVSWCSLKRYILIFLLVFFKKNIQIFPTIIKIKINAKDTGQMNRYW